MFLPGIPFAPAASGLRSPEAAAFFAWTGAGLHSLGAWGIACCPERAGIGAL
jgi:hypothetical protein